MPRFEILSGPILIGWSDLELGDPPMGCAYGRFFPSPDYSKVQSAVGAANGRDQTTLILYVRIAESGEVLDPIGGVCILDGSAEFGEAEGIEVSVLGLGYPRYEQLFPDHVTAYDALFK